MYAGTKKVEPPEDLIDFHLCRDVYHCTPSELDMQDAERVERHLIIWRQEQRAKQQPKPTEAKSGIPVQRKHKD